jgi:uncharacterized phage protein (TIGR02218 family)
MKTIPSGLSAVITSDLATLATCWKLTRGDGVVMGFTDHDKNLIHDSVTYEAGAGYTATAIATRGDYSVDDVELAGFLDSQEITEADVQSGIYDYAEVEVFLLDYLNPSTDKLILRKGTLGSITTRDGVFYTEIRGLMQNLQQNIGEVYQATCRAKFGSLIADGTPVIRACEFDLTTITETGTITSIEGRRFFSDTAREEDTDFFNLGVITFTSGDNSGHSIEIKDFTQNGDTDGFSGQFEIVEPLPYPVQIGDAYEAYPGCDKTPLTCRDTYNNLVNFRGDPFIPGMDKLVRVANANDSASTEDLFGAGDD